MLRTDNIAIWSSVFSTEYGSKAFAFYRKQIYKFSLGRFVKTAFKENDIAFICRYAFCSELNIFHCKS